MMAIAEGSHLTAQDSQDIDRPGNLAARTEENFLEDVADWKFARRTRCFFSPSILPENAGRMVQQNQRQHMREKINAYDIDRRDFKICENTRIL